MDGDRFIEPEGVEYTVRDRHGRVVEIVTLDGQRIYVGSARDRFVIKPGEMTTDDPGDDSEPAGPA